MSETLEDLLTRWSLGHLIEKCHELRVTKDTLGLCERGDLKCITPFQGEQIALWGHIRTWRASCTTPVTQQTNTAPRVKEKEPVTNCNRGDNCFQAEPDIEAEAGPSTTRHPKRRMVEPGSIAASKKFRSLRNVKFIDDLDVLQTLNNDIIGKEIVKAYKRVESAAITQETDEVVLPMLSESQRNSIVSIIIKKVLCECDEEFHYSLLQTVAQKIVSVFPTEKEETFYLGPRTVGQHQVYPRSKLFNKYKNEKSKARQIAQGTGAQRDSSIACHRPLSLQAILNKCATTPEIKAAELWLKTGRNWPMVVKNWEITAPVRFRNIFQGEGYINKYVDEWEVLKHKSGYELLLNDFTLIYQRSEHLYLRWESFVEQTLRVARTDVKDPKGKEFLKLLNEPNVTADSKAALLLSLLPSIRPNHVIHEPDEGKLKRRKVSVIEARESYLLHVKVGSDVKAKIREARDIWKGSDGGGRPLIVIQGSSLLSIEKAHVSVVGLLYTVGGVIDALDLFFKLFHVLHTPYPLESNHVLLLIQRVLYDIRTEWDSSCDIQQSWINSYDF